MRLFVPLTPEESAVLVSLARAERRQPQEQAAHILATVLSSIANRDEGSTEEVITPPPRDGGSTTRSAALQQLEEGIPPPDDGRDPIRACDPLHAP
jgi:hypothetical protein